MFESTELLRQLIAVRSVNPLLPGAAEDDDECALAAFVAGYLRSNGIDVELQEVTDGRCNVIGHVPRRGDADDAVILLTGHMDTYPAGGPYSDYRPRQDGNLLYGRGSADAKGPLAAMLTAFRTAARSPSGREAYIVATVDEECLLLGAKQLRAHGMRPALAITGEPTGLVPIVAQKGIVRGLLRVRGPHVHAAYPTSGGAITAAMRLVNAVDQLNAIAAEGQSDPELGGPTMTVTNVRGDGGMNLVAREVTIWFDGRFLPGSTGPEFLASVETELRRLITENVEFVMEPPVFVSPPNAAGLGTSVGSDFLSTIESVAGRCEPERFAYGSEAGVLAEFSADSVVFGPGDAHYSHAEKELIDVREVEQATEIFRRILVGVSP